MVGEAQSLIKPNPILTRWAPSNWEMVISQRFSDRSQSSKPHTRLPSLGVWKWEEGPSEQVVLKVKAGFDHKNPTSLGETETLLLEGTHKLSCAPRPGEKQWPHRSLGHTYLLVLEGLLWRLVASVAHYGNKDTGGSSSGEHSLAWALSRPPFSHQDIAPPKSLQASVLGCLRLTGQKYSTAHHQTGWLNSPWTHCLLNIPLDIALPTKETIPSSCPQVGRYKPHPPRSLHKPLRPASSIRGQRTEERRITTLQLAEWKLQP